MKSYKKILGKLMVLTILLMSLNVLSQSTKNGQIALERAVERVLKDSTTITYGALAELAKDVERLNYYKKAYNRQKEFIYLYSDNLLDLILEVEQANARASLYQEQFRSSALDYVDPNLFWRDVKHIGIGAAVGIVLYEIIKALLLSP